MVSLNCSQSLIRKVPNGKLNLVRKHFIDMSIDHDVLPVGRRHEAIPVRKGLESVMDHNQGTTLL